MGDVSLWWAYTKGNVVLEALLGSFKTTLYINISHEYQKGTIAKRFSTAILWSQCPSETQSVEYCSIKMNQVHNALLSQLTICGWYYEFEVSRWEKLLQGKFDIISQDRTCLTQCCMYMVFIRAVHIHTKNVCYIVSTTFGLQLKL